MARNAIVEFLWTQPKGERIKQVLNGAKIMTARSFVSETRVTFILFCYYISVSLCDKCCIIDDFRLIKFQLR